MPEFWEADPVVSPSPAASPPASGGGEWWASDPVVGDPATSGKDSGLARNFLAKGNTLLAGALGASGDIGVGAKNLVSRGINAAFGTDLPTDAVSPIGSEAIKSGMSAIGIANDQNVEARTAGEKLAGAAGEAVMGGALAGLGGAAVASRVGGAAGTIASSMVPRTAGQAVTDAGINAVAGATGQAAEEAVPDLWKPTANLAGNLIGGGLAATATAIPSMVKAGARQVRDYVAPLTEGGQRKAAARIVQGALSDETAVRRSVGQGTDEIVPGSKPTSGQQTGDMGLLALEKKVELQNPTAFNQRRADQNAARIEAIEGVQPTGAPEAVPAALRQRLTSIDATATKSVNDTAGRALSAFDKAGGSGAPEAVSAALRTRLAAIDKEATDKIASLADNARKAGTALGGNDTPEGYGSKLREAVRTASDAADARESEMWRAVDPGGKLALPVEGTREMAKRIRAELPRTNQGELVAALEPAEARLLSIANGMDDVEKFATLSGLRSEVSSALRKELADNGSTPTYRRLSMLRGAIEDDIVGAIDNIARREAEAVADGTMDIGDTLSARFDKKSPVAAPSGEKAAGAAGSGNAAGGNPAAAQADVGIGASAVPGEVRGGVPPGGRPLGGPGDPGLAGTNLRQVPRRPRRLSEFIADAGGLRPDAGGDLAAMDANRLFLPGRGKIVRERGLDLDRAREAAAEAGYFSPRFGTPDEAIERTTVNDFLDLIRDDIAGRNAFSILDEDTVAERAAALAANDGIRDVKGAARSIDALADETGLVVDKWMRMRAARMSIEEDIPIDDAIERLMIQAADEPPPPPVGASAADDFDFPGDRPPRKESIPTNFDEGAADRLKAASAVTKQNAETFERGSPAEVLKRSGSKGPYKLRDSSVGKQFFVPGKDGFTRVQEFRKAVGDDEAMKTLQDYAVLSMRDTAGVDERGVINVDKMMKWRENHQDALRAFPKLRQSIGLAADLGKLVGEAEARRQAVIKAEEYGVLGQLMSRGGVAVESPEDVVRTVSSIFGRTDSVTAMKQVVDRIEDNPAAMGGLRKAVVKFVTDKFVSNADGAAPGQATIRSDQFKTFMRDNEATLRLALSSEEIDALKAAAADLGRANSSAKSHGEFLRDERSGILGKLMGGETTPVESPDDVVRAVGSIFGRSDSATAMKQVTDRIGSDPMAREGLRKAVAEHITGKLISNTEVAASGKAGIKSDQFQTFVRQNEAALRLVFGDEEVKLLKDVAADLQRANRSVTAVRVPGGSDTFQKLSAQLNDKSATGEAKRSILTMLLGGAGGAATGGTGAVLGVLSGIAVNHMRQKGLNNVRDIVEDAILHPERLRLLLTEVKPLQAKSPDMTGRLRDVYQRALTVPAAVGQMGGGDGASTKAGNQR